MSYSCNISFKHAESIADVFRILPELKAETIRHLPEIAKDNAYYMPVSHKPEDSAKRDLTDPDIRKTLYNWARASVFSHRIFYIESMQLLGIFSLHHSVYDCMDGSVYFQNSCDQDYDRDTYAGIPAFLDIYDKWTAISADTYLSLFDNSQNDFDEDEIEQLHTDPEYLQYYLRTAAYAEIWACCQNALYDDATSVSISLFNSWDMDHIRRFILLSMNALNTDYKWLLCDDDDLAALLEDNEAPPKCDPELEARFAEDDVIIDCDEELEKFLSEQLGSDPNLPVADSDAAPVAAAATADVTGGDPCENN